MWFCSVLHLSTLVWRCSFLFQTTCRLRSCLDLTSVNAVISHWQVKQSRSWCKHLCQWWSSTLILHASSVRFSTLPAIAAKICATWNWMWMEIGCFKAQVRTYLSSGQDFTGTTLYFVASCIICAELCCKTFYIRSWCPADIWRSVWSVCRAFPSISMKLNSEVRLSW